MKSTNQLYRNIFSISGRRRNYLSALATGLLFLLGFSTTALAAPILANHYTITVVNDQLANGNDNDVVTVEVRDDLGNLVDGVPLYFQIAGTSLIKKLISGDPGYAFPTGTVSYGYATTTVGSTGIQIFEPDINGKLVEIAGSPVTFNYVAGPPSTSNAQTKLFLDQTQQTADGVSQDKVHLHVVDATGNVLINRPVTVVFTIVPNGDPAAGGAVLMLGRAARTAVGANSGERL